MMYQKIVVPVDHGNRNLKTKNYVFTSGILESDCKPVLGEYMYYNGKYYSLSEQRIPYMRDKSSDERFFILTLFGIAKEAEKLGVSFRRPRISSLPKRSTCSSPSSWTDCGP